MKIWKGVVILLLTVKEKSEIQSSSAIGTFTVLYSFSYVCLRDGGCTKPCCTVGAYGSQVHHVAADWTDGGNTNIDDLGLACGPDNRIVGKDGGWTTRMNQRCEVEWIPPPQLDTGQARLNYYHRPERLLRPDEELEPQSYNNTEQAEPGSNEETRDTESSEPPPVDNAGEPGGPAPPEGRAA